MNKIRRISAVFWLVLMLTVFYSSVSVAETKSEYEHPLIEAGLVLGWGTGNVPEGKYEPVLLIGHLGYDMRACFERLRDHAGTVSIYIEPQINPVFESQEDIEFGIGVGLKYMYPLNRIIAPYIFGSVGPHYITVKTIDQANGFIFSDTIGAGVSFFISKSAAINVEYRLRHMSNAGLERPNLGINTHFGTLGFSLYF